MKRLSKHLTLLVCIAGLTMSCAKRYYPISPETLNYSATSNVDNVDLGYRYGVLRDRGNNRLAKKEDKRHIKVIAVKIANNTNDDMVIGSNYDFFSGPTRYSLLSPELIESTIKQNTLTYLPYLLLSFLTLNVTKQDSNYGQTTSTFPVGLIIGPGITVGNMLVASNANKKLITELKTYNLINQTIKPGQVRYGLIGLDASSYDPIVLKKVK